MKGLAFTLMVMLFITACQRKPDSDNEHFVQQKTLQAQLDTFLQNNPEIPGIVSSWRLRDNSLIQAASGFANIELKEPMTVYHKMGVASNTKVMTATIILQLHEEGKIKLNDPIGKYLSHEITDNICVLNGISYGNLITIRQLLKHTSGIYDFVDANFINSTLYFPDKNYTPEDLLMYNVCAGQPYFIPGTAGKYHYSSTNYILLGMIIQKITGQPFHIVLRDRIFTPLHLLNSSVWTYEKPAAPLAAGYNNGTDISDDNLSWTWATGGVVSQADEMNLFIKTLLHGYFFKKRETLIAMMQTTTESVDEYGYEYGLGLMKYNFGKGFIAYGHIGSLHGYNSACFYLPLHDASFFVGINRGNAQPFLFDLMGQCYSCVVANYEYNPFQHPPKTSLPFPFL
ncbi:MAG: beta-lactamase family protein [Bacteroidia bacterium]|nr:beta-lactamase family protein [Bacteroidia bacterium]